MTKNQKAAVRQALYRLRHPERARAAVDKYQAENHEKVLARRRELYPLHRAKNKEAHKKFCDEHPGYHATWHRNKRKEDPERYKGYESRRVRPPGQRNASLRKWSAKKQATDLNWRILKNLRTRLWFALKGKSKSASTAKLLGCSIESFKIHIESLFELEMSWDNYGNKEGQWSCDHIIPCDHFDLTKPEHQRRCFHFSNLRPFWHVDNLRKGAKHEEKAT